MAARLALYGAECVACGYPAHHIVIHPEGRTIHHHPEGKGRRCELPNEPPAPGVVMPSVRGRNRPRRRPLLPCGTVAAYKRHMRGGELPCDACKAANWEYKKAKRDVAA